MFDECKKTTGTHYTATAALLVGAFIFNPAILSLSRPVDILSMSLAAVWSIACVTMAWLSWKRSSQFFNLSIVSGSVRQAGPAVTR
jgi:hypothetical protein